MITTLWCGPHWAGDCWAGVICQDTSQYVRRLSLPGSTLQFGVTESSCVTCLLNAVEKILKKSSQFSFSYIQFTPAKAMNVCACVYDQSISCFSPYNAPGKSLQGSFSSIRDDGARSSHLRMVMVGSNVLCLICKHCSSSLSN